MSLFAHATRSMGLDHNPLRRTSDRVEGWAKLTAVLVLAVVTPIVTVLAAYSAYQDGLAQERADAQARQRVEATLVGNAAPTNSSGSAGTVLAQASWAAPNNSPKSGWVRASSGATAGAVVSIWVDQNGDPTTAPREHEETLAVTTATAVLVPLVAMLVIGVIHLVIRVVLDRRRSSQWRDAWQRVEPGWSGRHV